METIKIRVLIVDDHPIVREGLATIIDHRSDMKTVGEACNGRQAVEMFRELQPDITLMDLRMPEMDGVEAIVNISQIAPAARIIVLTTFDADEEIYRGLHAGAKGFLLKDAPREQLIEAIRNVHAGQLCIPPNIAGKLAARVSSPNLTPREMDVLQLIASGQNNHEIGATLFITEGTVKAHINHILTKLNVSDRTQAVMIALKRGLIFLD